MAGAGVHGDINLPVIVKIDFHSARGPGVLKFYAALFRDRVSEVSRDGGVRSA